MKNVRLITKQKQIEDLFAEVGAFSGEPVVKAYLTYYLCIRVSGFIEDCIRSIFSEYVDVNSQNFVTVFVGEKLKKIPNPTWDAIIALAKDFDDGWYTQLKHSVGKPYRDALDSIVSNRNIIAHGGTSSITLSELEGYYRDAINVVNELERICC